MLTRLFGKSSQNNAVFDEKLENAKRKEEEELIESVKDFYERNIYEFWEQFIYDNYEVYQPVLKRPYTVKDEYEKPVYDYAEFKRTFTTLMRKIKRLSDNKKKSFYIPDKIKNYEVVGKGNNSSEKRIRIIQEVFNLKGEGEGEKTDGEENQIEEEQQGGKHRKYNKKSSKRSKKSSKRSKKSKKRSTKKSKKHTTKK